MKPTNTQPATSCEFFEREFCKVTGGACPYFNHQVPECPVRDQAISKDPRRYESKIHDGQIVKIGESPHDYPFRQRVLDESVKSFFRNLFAKAKKIASRTKGKRSAASAAGVFFAPEGSQMEKALPVKGTSVAYLFEVHGYDEATGESSGGGRILLVASDDGWAHHGFANEAALPFLEDNPDLLNVKRPTRIVLSDFLVMMLEQGNTKEFGDIRLLKGINKHLFSEKLAVG